MLERPEERTSLVSTVWITQNLYMYRRYGESWRRLSDNHSDSGFVPILLVQIDVAPSSELCVDPFWGLTVRTVCRLVLRTLYYLHVVKTVIIMYLIPKGIPYHIQLWKSLCYFSNMTKKTTYLKTGIRSAMIFDWQIKIFCWALLELLIIWSLIFCLKL